VLIDIGIAFEIRAIGETFDNDPDPNPDPDPDPDPDLDQACSCCTAKA